MQTKSFIGMDAHKATISISIAEDGRDAPVRFLGVIPNAPDDIAKTAKKLSKHGQLQFCYEAGGCGYGIYRQLTALGHNCTVAATSKIPRKPGERIKTDRRDSQKLAILHRSGDLTSVWVPDPTHEGVARPGPGTVGRLHAPDARPSTVARVYASPRTFVSDRQALDTTSSLLARRTDFRTARSPSGLSGLR